MTIQEILTEGKRLLRVTSLSSFIATPDLDAALLLSEVLHKSREELLVRGNESIAGSDREKFLKLLERRRNGECVAYILGHKEFRGLEFTVNPNVLIPRPDTETLVEAALEYIDPWQKASGQGDKFLSLLDLCTGSGAVAISLKNERPFLSVSASDISEKALEIAALNATRLLNSSVSFIKSDLFDKVPGKFDIIVSNPPYIPTKEIITLAPELHHEPQLALDGGEDGLDLIRKIISRAQEHLLPKGVLLLEAGPEQMPAIKMLLGNHHYSDIRIHKDLADRDRVISAVVPYNSNQSESFKN